MTLIIAIYTQAQNHQISYRIATLACGIHKDLVALISSTYVEVGNTIDFIKSMVTPSLRIE